MERTKSSAQPYLALKDLMALSSASSAPEDGTPKVAMTIMVTDKHDPMKNVVNIVPTPLPTPDREAVTHSPKRRATNNLKKVAGAFAEDSGLRKPQMKDRTKQMRPINRGVDQSTKATVMGGDVASYSFVQ